MIIFQRGIQKGVIGSRATRMFSLSRPDFKLELKNTQLQSGLRSLYPESGPHPYHSLKDINDLPPMDQAAFGALAKTAIIWSVSFSIFGFILGTMGYSYWWHMQREKARKAGIDLDEWLNEFEKTDPVVQFLKSKGLQK